MRNKKCPKCNGRGIIEIMGGVIVKRCETCKGKGEVEDDPIGGAGQDNNRKQIPVQRRKRKIKVGKKSGDVKRLSKM